MKVRVSNTVRGLSVVFIETAQRNAALWFGFHGKSLSMAPCSGAFPITIFNNGNPFG